MSNDVKNFFLAIGISILIFLGFNYFYPPADTKNQTQQQTRVQQGATPQTQPQKDAPLSKIILERSDAIQLADRAFFETNNVKGSINLKTGAIDDLYLKKYKKNLEKDSPDVALLNPADTSHTNILSVDLINIDQTNTEDAIWTSETTTDRRVVILTKVLSNMTIKRTFTFDEDYSVKIHDVVLNTTEAPLKLRSIQKTTMAESDLVDSFTAITEGKLREMTPSSLVKKDMVSYPTYKGWIGAGSKYWFTALMQPYNLQTELLFAKTSTGYEMRLSYPAVVIGPNGTMQQTYWAFCGPKKLEVLEEIRDAKKIAKFDLAVDFGWFYFITKPLLKGINWVHKYVGNFGWAILILTTLMKVLLWPLAVKSHKSMAAMKRLQPKINKIKEKFADDKIRLNQEIMALYKKENVKPMGGCLPILLQIPIFFCLYKVLSVNIEMRHQPFIWWIKDLSEPDPTSFVNLFGLLPFDPPAVLMIGLLPILMGLTMFIQQKLTPTVSADPSQEKVMLLMPLFLTYVFASFPSGLVLYWLWSNALSILQQIWMNKKMG